MRRIVAPSLFLSAALSLLPAPAQADARARKYYYEDIAQPFFALDASRPGMYRNQRPGSKTGVFAAVKPKDGFRVFVLGGSIAALLQYSGEERELAKALEAALPSRKVEVLNCGMAGYDSYREAMIEQEILEHSPDLIVFLTGHNEGIASAPFPIWIMKAQERLSRLSAYRALVKSLRPDLDPAFTDASADARDAAFAKNLAANIRHARARGVEVALVVPPRNYREPVELGRMVYDVEFVAGWIAFLRGDYAGARRSWKESLASGPRPGLLVSAHKAFSWGLIARSEEMLGLADEARASFEQAAAFDRAAICGAACQDIIRAAARNEDGFVVEADRMFRALAHPRMPSMETFNDRMHWKPRFNCLMSSAIIASARANPRLGALPWDDARVRALEASCVKPGGPGDEDDDRRILSYVLMGLSWPGFDRLSTVSVSYLQAIRRHRPNWFKDVPALVRMTKNPQTEVYGLEMAPDAVVLPRFYWHIGEARLLEKDYSGAVRDFSKALELDPKLSWARLSLAVAETLRGDKKRGLALLKETAAGSAGDPRREDFLAAVAATGKALGLGAAEELAAGNPEHWIKKAEAAAAAGSRADGVAALDRAAAMSPEPHQLRLIGQYYRMFHETDKFLALSDALTAAYPKDVDLWLMRAEASFMKGRAQAGAEALERAEKLAPDAAQAKLIARWRASFMSGGK